MKNIPLTQIEIERLEDYEHRNTDGSLSTEDLIDYQNLLDRHYNQHIS